MAGLASNGKHARELCIDLGGSVLDIGLDARNFAISVDEGEDCARLDSVRILAS